jgi:hypothetical protein
MRIRQWKVENPLMEYNMALKKLQKRRRMTPVSLTMLQGHPDDALESILQHPTSLVQLSSPWTTSTPIPKANKDEGLEGDEVSEPLTEVEQIIQDLEDGLGDETLPRLTEDDVALDMDVVLVEEEYAVDEEESDMDKEIDIGWVDGQEWEALNKDV